MAADLYLSFLPSVQDLPASEHVAVQRTLADRYLLPSILWTRAGYEASGFYSSWRSPLAKEDVETSHCTDCSDCTLISQMLIMLGSICRFLVKDYQPDTKQYKWYYITICSIWFQKRTANTAATQIHLCFGLPHRMRLSIAARFQESYTTGDSVCSFEEYLLIISAVVEFYDDIVWKFRTPVRDFEKAGHRPSINTLLLANWIFNLSRRETKTYCSQEDTGLIKVLLGKVILGISRP